MNVWRIGSNWGGDDIFPVFKNHKMAFAGAEVESYAPQVKAGDIMAITKGQEIIAIGKVQYKCLLSEINQQLADTYDHVTSYCFDNLFCKKDFPQYEFGNYGGQGKQFHKAHNDYITSITTTFNKIYSVMQNQNLSKLLEHKKQLILTGPPGTGKTYMAEKLAAKMVEDIDKQIALTQFHPSTAYEDFVRGIEAKTEEGGLTYASKDKVLLEMAKKAKSDPENKYVLIIDEINRANLPSVLGELIYALEYRGEEVNSLYADHEDPSNFKISLPENLLIIGTMNTADRSVGHIDYAIRRRFAFHKMLPKQNVVEEFNNSAKDKAVKAFTEVQKLFMGDTNKLNAEFKAEDVRIGHSYFLAKDEPELEMKLKYEVRPLLEEYIKDGILNMEVSEIPVEIPKAD